MSIGGHDHVPLYPQGIEVWTLGVESSYGPTGYKGERTMPTLNTAVVLLLIVDLHLNVVVRVGWEPGTTNDSIVVLWTEDNSQKTSKLQ